MAPPHRCVALMAAVAAAALLLTLDAPVASCRAGNPVKRGRGSDSDKPRPFLMTEAERLNTLKVLQAFAAALPSLGWSGDDFCSWSGVTCLDTNVGLIITSLRETGTLPEMPDDVDYSMVPLDYISIFGQHSGIIGTLPSSWGKLYKVRAINLSYTGISGTLPASWSSMEAIEQIIISNTQIIGNLPEAWSALPNLQRIHLQGCSLSGSLPASWARMPSLERLDLRKNKFCGCVPQLWLLAGSMSVDVDRRHNFPHCLQAEGCDETTTPEPIGNSMSSTSLAELTTLSPTSDHQCSVPNCISCFPRNSKLCGVCIDGYVLTDDGQCVKSLDLGTVPITMSEAERVNTLRVLQAFAAAMPSLGWSGDNFCSWSYVTCFDTNVSLIITSLRETGTLPEMPDDVDYSMVRLDQIHLFGQDSGITGTLPSSWGKLRRVRTINLAYTGISGTLPAAWSSMEAVEEIVLSNTEISGTLPEAWGMMRNLWKVYLEGCSLYGSFPESWVEMPSVERVSLHKNHFCGCLPQSWLTSPIFRVAVDVKHRTANCSTAEACNEMRMSQPVASTFTIMTAEPSTPPVTVTTDRASAASASAATKPSTDNKAMGVPPAPAAVQCSVSMCAWCVPGNMGRCGVCSYGHVLTVDGQCMKNCSPMEAKPFIVSETEWWNTLKVLQAFAAAMPSLGWSGGDFCSWRCVRCTDGNAGFVVSKWWVSGTLPEMPDDVDYSMVRLEEISIFSQQRGITGTLPSSWGKLRTVRTINLAYAAITGTLPSSWGKLRKVRTINVAYTAITGTLPESWGKLREVRTINLAYTGITGTLPSSWGKLRKVQTINLSYTGISGTLPSAWSSMETIEQIIFSSSQISGTLPQAWGTMPNLRRVDLQRCSLYGPLPESWVQMPSLERLELRNNDFCGCVPESWLRSPILLMAVDVWHRMASCATADACTDVASTQNSTSNSDDQDG